MGLTVAVLVVVLVGAGILLVGRDDLHATGPEGAIEVLELVVVDVNLTKGDLDVVLRDAPRGLCGLDKLAQGSLELGGELRIVLGLLTRCHGLPLDCSRCTDVAYITLNA